MSSRPFLRAIHEMRDRHAAIAASMTEPAPLTSWLEPSRRPEPDDVPEPWWNPRRIFAAVLAALTILGAAGGAYEWLLK